ncbi:MAG: SpoVR family protein, partial [Candidatus Tagabacteria bacterium CG_4_8_14_3_um_filter_41_8]
MHLYEFIEELARKGKISYGFQLIKDSEIRRRYDEKKGEEYAKKVLLEARKNFDDFMLINFLSDDDFQDFVNKYNLFVAGARFNPDKWIIKIYIKSRSGKAYREM